MSTESQFSKTFISTATLNQYQRVKIDSANGEVVVAGNGDANSIGCVARDVLTAGDPVAVYLDAPVRRGIADAAIAAGAIIYQDDAGELDDTAPAGNNQVGIALEAAGAGEHFDYIPTRP